MNDKYKLIVDSFGKDRVKINEILKDYTAIKVGGPAKLFFIAFTTSELVKIITFCRQLHLPVFLFGTGSKMMLSDQGFEGVVIKNRTKNLKVLSVKGKVSKFGIGIEEALMEVDSGVGMPKLVEFLDSQGLSSLEFNKTIGSVGGNLFLNKNLIEKTESVKVLNQDCKTEKIIADKINLRQHIILSVVLKIKAKNP